MKVELINIKMKIRRKKKASRLLAYSQKIKILPYIINNGEVYFRSVKVN